MRNKAFFLAWIVSTSSVVSSTAQADEQPAWAVSVSAASTSPVVLASGLALGTLAEVQWRDHATPWFVSSRLGWSKASAANVGWVIDHHQLVGAVGGGVTTTFGVGRLWAHAGGGVGGVYETLNRHQGQRLQTGGVSDASRTALVFGPHGFGEIGLELRLQASIACVFAAGPTISRTKLAALNARWRWGGAARLGVAVGF